MHDTVYRLLILFYTASDVLLAPNLLSVDLDVQRVLFDELASRSHGVAHENREQLVGLRSPVLLHLEKRPLLRVHGRLPELVGAHLAQALVPLDVDPRLG